jgi:hypothetical protein
MAVSLQRAFDTMRVGDTFGAGRGGTSPEVSLFCQIDGIKGHTATVWVINGCWEFGIDRRTGRGVPTKGMEHLSGCEVLFTGYLPWHVQRDFGEVLAYMQERAAGPLPGDGVAIALLAEAEAMAFDGEGEVCDISSFRSGRVIDMLERIRQVVAEVPLAPGAAELLLLRDGAFTGRGLAAAAPEEVVRIRDRVRGLLGMREYEDPRGCIPF